MAQPNDPVTLYEGTLELVKDDTISRGAGSVVAKWFPSVGNVFEVRLDDYKNTKWLTEQRATLIVPELNVSAEALITADMSEGLVTVRGVFKQSVEVGGAEKLSSVVFHLVNFVDFIGETLTDGEKNWRRHGFTQEDEQWRVIIHGLKNVREIYDALKTDGGYAVTHVGKLEKVSGKTFSSKEAVVVVNKLFWYLSFVKGLYSPPLLVVGFDDEGNKIWEFWKSRVNQPIWQDVSNWFPRNFPSLNTLFGNYMSVSENEELYEAIRNIINWYLESQSTRFPDQGIIWAQLGLEALAWTRFADKYISRDGFERLPMADRLRLLLSDSDIPIEIPKSLTELHKAAKEFNWNGPGSIAELRNKIVHPNLNEKDRQKLKTLGIMGKYEAQELCKWYLELALLRFFNYSGEYHNRLHRAANVLGKEPVPWSNEV